MRRPVGVEGEDDVSERWCVWRYGAGAADEERMHSPPGMGGLGPKSQAKNGKLAALAPRTCTPNFC